MSYNYISKLLQQFLKKLRANINDETTEYKSNNFVDKFGINYICDFNFSGCNTLILSGGAFKCTYFLGALSRLNNLKFKYYAGTSSGAIIITLLSVGYTPIEIFKELYKTPEDLSIYNTLDFVLLKVEKLLEKKGLIKNITFKDMMLQTGKQVAFIASNISKLREEVFSAETHPLTPVIVGLRMSCSLPIIFPVAKYNNDIYSDGIFFDNFPIKLSNFFNKTYKVIAITTSSSHYDKRITNYYSKPDIYKIIIIPDYNHNYFHLKSEDKFYMFITGFNYINDHICNQDTVRRNSI